MEYWGKDEWGSKPCKIYVNTCIIFNQYNILKSLTLLVRVYKESTDLTAPDFLKKKFQLQGKEQNKSSFEHVTKCRKRI